MLLLRDIADVAPPLQPLAPGMRLGAYELERVLGEGSMGRVFLARHTRLGRHVALKVLHDELLKDQGLVQRFLQEGRVVNHINHAHIVEVYDFVEEPGRVYCVMEFLTGKTLAQRAAEQPLSIAQIRSVGRQIASALGAAHVEGVVHRDLKPENVLLVPSDKGADRAKVLDFGVAKTVGVSDLKLFESQQGALLGTPLYMAPEQAAGLEVDARTDVYALGTVLYELVAGRPPFDAAAFGQLAADIITREPPPLPTVTPGGEEVPASLEALIVACLAKKPEDRPASMKLVERALAADDRWPQRRVRLVRWGSIAAVLVGMAAFALTRPQPPVAPAPVPPEQPPSVVLPPNVPAPLDDGALPLTPTARVTLSLHSEPEGAAVLRAKTGELLGHTPLELKVPRGKERLSLRFELDGYHPLERTVSSDENQRIEFTLRATPRPRKVRPITDGVLDPY